MAGLGVMGCVAAVVSAFHGGAELMQAIKERRGPPKRRKEKDMEQAFEEKMLHKSLVEGANQCHSASVERQKRFGPKFDRGDQIATSELKDVMICLQTEVVSALQIARAVENATLDLSRLHEASITNKNNAIRAMDALCQRLISAAPVQRTFSADDYPPQYSLQAYRDSFSQGRDSTESFDSLSSLPAKGNSPPGPSTSAGRAMSNLRRSRHVRHSLEGSSHRSVLRESSQPGPAAWNRYEDDIAKRAIQIGDNEDERDEPAQHPAMPGADRMNKWSFNDSGFGGSDTGSRKGTGIAPSVASTTDDRYGSSISGASHLEKQSDVASSERNVSVPSRDFTPDTEDDEASEGSQGSRSSTPPGFVSPRQHSASNYDSDRERSRADSAPEVVTTEFESRLTLAAKGRHQTFDGHHGTLSPMPNVHPAFRDIYLDGPDRAVPEPEQIWAPLSRPAKFNDYHGFCRGAWQTRQAVQEGLAITMIPNYKGVEVPHWKCKQCEFRSKGVNNSKVLPDQVFYDKCGVRYRWLFLAKSHVRARTAHNKPELYSYGCVFCAAEGRETAVHKHLEALMSHIINKHKTHMMTPEVMSKAKCVVGGAPNRSDEWDINLPPSHAKKISGVVNEFFLAATTGLSKHT